MAKASSIGMMALFMKVSITKAMILNPFRFINSDSLIESGDYWVDYRIWYIYYPPPIQNNSHFNTILSELTA